MKLSFLFLFGLGLFGPLRAEGPLVELEGKRGFWASTDAPESATKFLGEMARNAKSEPRSFVFNRAGGWICLLGGNAYVANNTEAPLNKKLSELQGKNADFQCVAFAPAGGWTLLFGGNGMWTEGQTPDAAFKKMGELGKQGKSFRSIAYGPNGAWVLLYDKAGVAHGSVTKDLAERLDQLAREHVAVRCVSFIGKDWICLSDKGWWTSNVDLPASKHIAEALNHGVSPKWVASRPGSGAHDFAKWQQVIREAYDGKLAGGYGFEVRQHGNIVATGAEGWARAPMEKEHPSVQWTLDKPMGIASLSKTITAVGLLKLWEETHHSFSLDEPFWPFLKGAYPEASEGVKRITFRHLLTHHSGFNRKIEGVKDLKALLSAPLLHPPGAVGEYENNNFFVLRVLIEQIGHVEYTPYMKTHVLEPMDIKDMETHFQADAPTCGYGKLEDNAPGYPFKWDQAAQAGPAGWFGSVRDVGKFLSSLRNHTVLNAETTEAMFKGGLGWDASTTYWMKNGGWFGHAGSRAGALHSVIVHFPDDVDAVLLANCEPPVAVEPLVLKAWRESLE